MLTFAYAEAQEIKKEFANVHATYDKFLTLLRSQLETLEQTIAPGPANTSPSSAATVPTDGSGNGVVNNSHAPATEPGIQSTNSSFNTQGSDEKPSKNTELHGLCTCVSERD